MSRGDRETRARILDATRQLMEARGGVGVRMGDIAKAAGVSRQALYLHFDSRTDLMVATTRYMDEILDLASRTRAWEEATGALEKLDAYVEFWGRYVPEIHGIGRALLAVRERDEAAAAAWDDRMEAVRSGCRITVDALAREGRLAPGWSHDAAVDLFWALLSIPTWEQFTRECGWSVEDYIQRTQRVLRATLVKEMT